MILAIPFDVVLTFPLVHGFSFLRGSPTESLSLLSPERSNPFGSLSQRLRFYDIISGVALDPSPAEDGFSRASPL
jgi:hypothetical protein